MRTAVSMTTMLCLFSACLVDRPVAPRTDPSSSAPSFALSAAAAAGKTYVLQASGNALPAGLDAAVRAAGGTLTTSLNQIGVAIAVSTDPQFPTRAAGIRGISDVAEDVMLDFALPRVAEQQLTVADVPDVGPAVSVGALESFRPLQWAPNAISATAAWDAGAMGAGVRVAILDGGIHSTHIDIAPGLDIAASRSFVPGQPFNFDQRRDTLNQCILNDTFWHGTHVAGIVAAPANNLGTVGIAPQATIIGVKVLHCGSGSFSWIIPAIVYAATPIAEDGAGADIINMSLGALVRKNGPGVASLLNALSRATSYARKRGTLVIASAGNDDLDLDHAANLVSVPAQSVGVLAVSATGPVGFAQGATNYDRPASYTNYGQSAISFGAPGGDFAFPGNAACSLPRNPMGVVTTACWVFDMVMAPCRGTSNGSYCWAAGTSMASPAAAGVAALIIGKYGRMSPAQLEEMLRATADDLGKPGNDDFYGGGRVNAARAVGVQ